MKAWKGGEKEVERWKECPRGLTHRAMPIQKARCVTKDTIDVTVDRWKGREVERWRVRSR